jgi:hypothetical protein
MYIDESGDLIVDTFPGLSMVADVDVAECIVDYSRSFEVILTGLTASLRPTERLSISPFS